MRVRFLASMRRAYVYQIILPVVLSLALILLLIPVASVLGFLLLFVLIIVGVACLLVLIQAKNRKDQKNTAVEELSEAEFPFQSPSLKSQRESQESRYHQRD